MPLTHQDVKSTEQTVYHDESYKLQFSIGGKSQSCFEWEPKTQHLTPTTALVVWEMAASGEQKILNLIHSGTSLICKTP